MEDELSVEEREKAMDCNFLHDDIGEIITDDKNIVLISEKGIEKDIRHSVVINKNGVAERRTRYGSNKADE